MAPPDPARRIRAASDFPRWLAAWAGILAHPDRQGFRERSIAWLCLAMLLSLAAHLALLTTLGAVPRRYEGAMRLTLNARLAPPPRTAYPEHPFPDSGPTPALPARAEPPAPGDAAASAQKTAEPSADAGAPLVLPEQYFRSRDLDVPAAPAGKIPLVFPQGAFHQRLHGTVRVRVFIGADGSVESLELVSVTPPGYHFEQAALEAMRLMRYRPAIKDGQPVRSQKVIEVSFDPEGNAPAPGRPQ